MERRGFIKLAGGGLAVSFLAGCSIPPIPSRPDASIGDASGWISHRDGRYILALPRAEIGQNIAHGLKCVACTELGVPWDDVEVRLASTASIAHYRATVGSESAQDYAVPLAQACATLRDRLVAGQMAGELEAEDRAYDTLRAFKDRLPEPGPLHHAHEIVTGAPLYASDIRLAGMVFGRVLRAPVSPDITSKPQSWNETAAKAVPGFVAIASGEGFTQNKSAGLGIVGETPGSLDRIAAALDVVWDIADQPDQAALDAALDIDQRVAAGGADHELVDETIEAGDWDVDLRFDIPLGAHAPIEPRVAVADVKADQAKIWVGSQDPFYVRDVVAGYLDLDEDEVIINPCRVGGAFGGKTIVTVELEAAALSKSAGRPVKVQWTRAQELAQGFHRPQTSHRVSARVDNGRVTAWRHRLASGHVIFTNAVLPPWLQRVTDFIGDDGAARGALPPYNFTARQIGFDVVRLPVLTGPWRGLGAGPNGFAIECAMDECALTAGLDPVDFRRDHIEDPRLLAVLDRVAHDASWDGRKGLGIACGTYKSVSYAAVAAEVTLTGEGLRVERMWCAHECGRMLDPDQVRAQCEGNLMWGVGMALTDRLTIENGGIAATDFIDAPIPTMADAPEMHIALLESGERPVGAGETGIVAAAAAIGNAVRSLTGVRVTQLPIDPGNLTA